MVLKILLSMKHWCVRCVLTVVIMQGETIVGIRFSPILESVNPVRVMLTVRL